MRVYILILVAVLLCGAAFAADLLDSKVTFYTSDTKAFITDSTYAKIADVELTNTVTKSGGQLWLQDCELFTCSLYVDFTPAQEYEINEKDFGGVVVGSDRVHYSMAYLYTESVVEGTRPTYTEKLTTVELCTTGNVTLKTTCKNETKTEMVQTGVETYEETIGGYEEVKDGAALKAGEKYRFRFDYTRDNSNEVADLQPKLFNTIEGWAWWEDSPCPSGYSNYHIFQINSTANTSQANGVVAVVWNSSADVSSGYLDVAMNGIYFMGSDEKKMPHELENNTNNTSTTVIWLGVPIFENKTVNQTIKMCMSPSENSAQNASGVWSNNFSVVYHFAENATLRDSLGNLNLSRNVTYGNCPTISGKFGNGVQMQNCVYFVNGIAGKLPTAKNASTISYWENFYGQYASADTVGFAWGANSHVRAMQYREASTAKFAASFWSDTEYFASTLWSGTQYIGMSYDGATTVNAYQNSTKYTGTITALNTATSFLYIGAGWWDMANQRHNATYDEFRIANVSRSDDWMQMEYGAFSTDYGVFSESVATAPTLQSISLYPATLYKNMTASCAVNWTHTTNSTFTVYQGLTRNGTILDSFNQTNAAYANGTIWNYTAYPLSVEFTHGDKLACWSRANSTDANSTINYTANITIGNWPPIISNVQITNPLQNGSNATGSATFSDVEGDTINCIFQWYRNGTSIWNASQSPCANSSTLAAGNYSVSDLINFTVFANDSYDGVFSNASSATVTVLPTFSFNNYTWTGTQYESLSYTYTVNYTLPIGNNMTYTNLEYNGMNITPSCSNVSTTYYCSVSVPAPPEATNGTAEVSYWWVNYTDGSTSVLQSTTFSPTVYYGVWATAINSVEEIPMGSYAWINVSYSNVSGFADSLSANVEMGGASAAASCSSYICSANVVAPTVTSPVIYRTSGNYTLTSSYWTTSVTRTVLFETVTGMETSTIQTTSGGITNPSNYNDTNWATYATINYNAYFLFNYTLPKMANFTAFRSKDTAGTRNDNVPEECWGSTVQFKAHRYPTAIANYSCYSYEDDAWVAVDAYTFVTNYYMYEENLSFTYNNSYTRVVPYGLQVCSGIGTTVFHYNAYDEGTLASLVVTYAQAFELDTGLVQSNHSTSGSDNSWDICYYPDTLTGNVSSFEEFSATGYADHNNFLNGVVLEDGPYNVSIYLLNSSDAKLTIVTVKENGLAVEGATVYVQRYYPANTTFTTVATLETDDSGKSAVYLNPNGAYYKFIVLENGEIVHTSSSQQVICDPAESMCSVILNIVPSQLDYWTYYGEISGTCTANETAKTISCVYADTHGTLTYARLIVTKIGVTATTTVCDTNSSSSSGTLFCALGVNATGVYTYYLMGKYNPEYSLDSGSVDLGVTDVFGGNGLLLGLLMFLTLAFIGLWSPPVGIILGLFALAGAFAIGMVDVSWAAIAAIFVSGIILAIKMRS